MFALVKDAAFITRYIRKLRGGSQPILAEASDGHLYVVKFTNNIQGANLAFNESIGSELYRAVRLPVPPWKPLHLTDSFVDRNPACWMETESGFLRPNPGLCFGSRFLGGAGVRLFEILPESFFARVQNLENFWPAWLVDICAGHVDNRQAIFKQDGRGRVTAVFIDHGHMFGGPKGTERRHFRASAYLDSRIYPCVYRQFLEKLKRTIANMDSEKLWKQIKYLPDAWKSDSAIGSFARCLGVLFNARLVDSIIETIVCTPLLIGQRERFDAQPGERLPLQVLCTGVPATELDRGAT